MNFSIIRFVILRCLTQILPALYAYTVDCRIEILVIAYIISHPPRHGKNVIIINDNHNRNTDNDQPNENHDHGDINDIIIIIITITEIFMIINNNKNKNDYRKK